MARRFARRRKPRVVWLPMLGNAQGTELETWDTAWGTPINVPVAGDGSIRYDIAEVTFDAPLSASEAASGDRAGRLHDIVSGNAYRLRRLVGKIHIGFNPGRQTEEFYTYMPACDVAAGFMVLRTDPDGAPTADLDEVNPLTRDSAEDPWIWRRRWLFGTGGTSLNNQSDQYTAFNNTPNPVQGDFALTNFPATTAGYGSVADGPHIDQKTGRVIGEQESLFFFIATRRYAWVPSSGLVMPDGLITGHLDLRLLASLRTSQGNRRNASR